MTATLATLGRGRTATVQSVDAEPANTNTAARLMALGFVPGESVKVVAAAPGGFPIAVRVGGSIFALREHEAALVNVSFASTHGSP